jgi:hypothetical protein
MSEVKKLTNEELQTIRDIKQEYNNLALSLGELVIQKSRLLESQKLLSEKEDILAKQLTEKYGQGTINIDTGEIN